MAIPNTNTARARPQVKNVLRLRRANVIPTCGLAPAVEGQHLAAIHLGLLHVDVEATETGKVLLLIDRFANCDTPVSYCLCNAALLIDRFASRDTGIPRNVHRVFDIRLCFASGSPRRGGGAATAGAGAGGAGVATAAGA